MRAARHELGASADRTARKWALSHRDLLTSCFEALTASRVIDPGKHTVTEHEIQQFAISYDPQFFHTRECLPASGTFLPDRGRARERKGSSETDVPGSWAPHKLRIVPRVWEWSWQRERRSSADGLC